MNKFIHPTWGAPKHVKSLITTRHSGTSQAPYDSFNLGLHVNDNKSHVTANQQILQRFLPSEPLWLKQSHSNNVYIVGSTANLSEHEYDAIISYEANKVCAILSADCLPILVTNVTGDFVAAIHAGWRGLYNNIISETINKINSPSTDILVYIGPSICAKCFTVKADLVAKFSHLEDSYHQFFKQIASLDWQGDLTAIACLQLQNLGVPEQNISLAKECTKCNPQLYYSYRHSPITGRMASLIWLDGMG